MKPISLAILWHQHQPYYKKESEFILPWVRLHGVKDYVDLPLLIKEFPLVKQTINLVPSLMLQINEYIQFSTTDTIERLTRKFATELSQQEKREILRLFFLCNVQTMILPYPRYRQLYYQASDQQYNALETFSSQDWLDLQCWYNLTWIGQISRLDPKIQHLFANGSQFSETDKVDILNKHTEILASILPILQELSTSKQIEISVTPMYHPILPLVIDTNSYLESTPEGTLPEQRFAYPQDALWHLREAYSYYTSCFNQSPSGCWPPEGSLSTDAINSIKQVGFQWTATDEQVLYQTIGNQPAPCQHYFPHSLQTTTGTISVFFRDHTLSDTIGFLYSSWNAEDAANDFIDRILRIRNEIIHHFGEDALDEAVLSVILDGENCWEYYPDNGIHFLRALFSKLSHPLISTTTFTEALQQKRQSRFTLDHIKAGSWINGMFKIWIGNVDENKAWTILSQARKALEDADVSMLQKQQAIEALYIAEGSDAFWWYGDDHQAENRDDFDDLFRYYIAKSYSLIGLPIPNVVKTTLRKNSTFFKENSQSAFINLEDSRNNPLTTSWLGSGYIYPSLSSGSIHSNIEIIEIIRYARDREHSFIAFRIETKRTLREKESITFEIFTPIRCTIEIKKQSFVITNSEHSIPLVQLYVHCEHVLEFGMNQDVFFSNNENEDFIEFSITINANDTTIQYPKLTTYKISL